MSGDDILAMSGARLARLYADRALSPVEVTDRVLRRIEQRNPTINAFCLVLAESALQEARASERRWAAGAPLSALDGVPVSIKDLFLTRGARTAKGSRPWADYQPDTDSPVVQRLRAAGTVAVGKTTTPEFGWKGVTDSPLEGVTTNPWDTSKTAGGSSGGAAAALAGLMAPLAVGSDAGGSIRIPASYCGVVGHKPSLGRVPVWPASSTEMLSVAGPMTRTVEDAALLLDVLAGPHPRDHMALPPDPARPYAAHVQADVRGRRVAWVAAPGDASVAPDVAARVAQARGAFEALGCVVEDAAFPLDGMAEVFEVLWACGRATAADGLTAAQVGQFDPGLRQLITAAEGYSGADVMRALLRRAEYAAAAHAFMVRYDALICPTMPTTAFAAGVIAPRWPQGWQAPEGGERVPWLWWTPFTYPFNLTGQPAISVPCGLGDDSLPVGLQIVGRRFDDAGVLALAAAYERAVPAWAAGYPL